MKNKNFVFRLSKKGPSNKKMNKGQIGTTLTWFVAFIIIVFILLIFILISSFLAINRELSNMIPFFGRSKHSSDIIFTSENLLTQRRLASLLETPVFFDGKNISLKDATTIVMNPYYNGKFELYSIRHSLSQNALVDMGVVHLGGRPVREDEYFNLINSSLKDGCTEYLFQFPLGYSYYSLRGRETFHGYGKPAIGVSRYFNQSMGEPIYFEIPHKEHFIKIKLQSRRIPC